MAALSARAAGLAGPGYTAGREACDYIGEHISRLPDAYDPDTNPRGYLCCAIAENKATFPLLSPLFEQMGGPDVGQAGYDDPRGDALFRGRLARFWGAEIAPGHAVDPDHLVCCAGVVVRGGPSNAPAGVRLHGRAPAGR